MKIPVRASRHQTHHRQRDLSRYKRVDRMANEHICKLNSIPEVLPNLLLRTPLDPDKVAPNLDVAPVNDFDFWSLLFNQRDQTGHLGIVDDHDVSASVGKWTALAEPVALGVVDDPVGHLSLSLFVKSLGGVGDALEDVVIRFCDSEDFRIRLRDIPAYIYSQQTCPSPPPPPTKRE